MNINFNNKYIEIIFVLIISTLVCLFGIYYFQSLVSLYPVFFIVLGIKQGLIYGITTLALSSLLIGYMVDIYSGVFLLIAFGPLTFFIMQGIKRRKKASEILSISTLVFLVSIVAIYYSTRNITGVSLIAELKDAFNEGLSMQIKMLEEYGLTDFEIFQIKSTLQENFKIFLNIIPSMMIIASFIVSYINYLISSLILGKLGYGVVFIPRFSRFKLPRNIILGISIMILTIILLSNLEILNSHAVIRNLYVLGFLAFFLQGLSVIDYKLIEKNIGPILRFLLIAVTITLSSFIGGIIAIIGVLDVIFDFRKFRKIV